MVLLFPLALLDLINSTKHAWTLFGLAINAIGCAIFVELIIIEVCGLQENTKYYIDRRAALEGESIEEMIEKNAIGKIEFRPSKESELDDSDYISESLPEKKSLNDL